MLKPSEEVLILQADSWTFRYFTGQFYEKVNARYVN